MASPTPTCMPRNFERFMAISLPPEAGLLQMSKEAEEVCLLPLGLSHFAGGGSFVGVGVEDVEGEASDDGEVFRGVVLARAGVVFIEDDVEGPMQVVFDRPMRPDGVEELARAEAAREDEVAGG